MAQGDKQPGSEPVDPASKVLKPQVCARSLLVVHAIWKLGVSSSIGASEIRRRSWTLALPMVATWGLCAYGIGASQFRGDELCTWWAATLPEESFDLLIEHVDAVLAPYYLFMRWWIGIFGDSEAAMRAPAALAMGLCAGLVAALGTRLCGHGVGLRAGLVFAVIPIVSRYGQEARPYAFAALFATLSSLLLLRLLEKPASFGRAAAYAAALTALGLSHVVALLILPAHAACFLRITRQTPYLSIVRRPVGSFAIASSASIGCVLALIVSGAQQLPDQIGRHGTMAELSAAARRQIDGSTTGALVIGLVIGVLALRAAFSPRQHIMLRLWAAVPPAFLLSTYSVLHLWALRYIVFTLPALALLIANAIERPLASQRFRSLATTVAVVIVLVLGWKMQVKSRSSLARSSGDYRATATDLIKLAAPRDSVAFGGSKVIRRIPRLALAYQLRHGPSLNDVFVVRGMRELGGFVTEECNDSRACLPPTVQRVWLITDAAPSNLFEGMERAQAQLLEQEFAVSEVRPHWRANLALLTRKAQRDRPE